MKYIALEDEAAELLRRMADDFGQSSIWDSIAAALDAATSAPVVKVKPLVWTEYAGRDAHADTCFGAYAVWTGKRPPGIFWSTPGSSMRCPSPAPDIAAAKAAAEAHYQAAVRALLEE